MLVQLFDLRPQVVPLFAEVVMPAVIGLKAHLLRDPFTFQVLQVGLDLSQFRLLIVYLVLLIFHLGLENMFAFQDDALDHFRC